MVNKLQVYQTEAKEGDIILCHSKKFIAKGIQWVDNCYYHHCEVVSMIHGELVGIGAHPNESRIDFLVDRFKAKHWDDFCIVRPLKEEYIIKAALDVLLSRANSFSRYDKSLILRIFIYEKFGINIKFLGSSTEDICSEFVQYYLMLIGENNVMPTNINRPFFTPQDVLRYIDIKKYQILYKK